MLHSIENSKAVSEHGACPWAEPAARNQGVTPTYFENHITRYFGFIQDNNVNIQNNKPYLE